MAATVLLLISLLLPCLASPRLKLTTAQTRPIGVRYGRVANNLPSDQEVVGLYHSNGITKMRIYDPNEPTVQALRGSNIELMLGVPSGDIQALSDPSAASSLVQNNILAFTPGVQFRYIVVGNEIIPSDESASFVLPAMQNIYNAIASTNLQAQIKASTAIQTSLLGNSYPPSAGSFGDNANSYIGPIVQFQKQTGDPLLANVYPYSSYIGNTKAMFG